MSITLDHHIINLERKNDYRHLLIDNKLRIAITNACNLSCFYCHNEGQELYCQKHFLSLNYIKDMVNWFKTNKVYVESVNITGGEPLLHPQLIDIIDEVVKITDEVRINTNATLLTEELIDTMVDHGVYALKIGIDSLYAAQSKPSIVINSSKISHVLEMIRYASKKMRVVLNTVVTAFNYEQIDDMIKFARESGVPRIKVIRLHDFDPRGFNSVDGSDCYKTNQKEGLWYYYFYEKYTKLSVRIVKHQYKGRIDVFFNDGFEIRFCEDICTYGACGNMFTEIDSGGNIMICPKYHISKPIDFSKSFKEVADVIEYAKSKTCNSEKDYFLIRDKKGEKLDE